VACTQGVPNQFKKRVFSKFKIPTWIILKIARRRKNQETENNGDKVLKVKKKY
jgi:hypothetical protein